MAANQHYRSPFGDTTYTKVFVGGLAWETPTDVMQSYFEQFGEILEAVIITDKNTGKSKGYGFVTFRDPESARSACAMTNPVIDGRRANCNIASLGRPRPSPPRGRTQGGNYQGGIVLPQAASSSFSGVAGSLPPLPPPAPLLYPPAAYGYTPYSQSYGYHQHPHYYPQLYGATTTSSGMGSPYYYGAGYSNMQASLRGAFSAATQTRFQGPSYLYYPTQMEGSFSYPPTPLPTLQPTRTTFNTSTDSQTPLQRLTEADTTGAATTSSESPNNT
ncbi:hypothetical protein Leryth_017758 [Lithospermum erythrorhizon]|nr:hypothetical protein Leryth_017758 [Lithospermum erythrorhizon]